jgi:putative flippase GtrA
MNLPPFLQQFLRSEFFKYFVSGVIAFICDFGLLVLLTEVFGVHYLLSNVAGYAVGLIVSYTLNIKYVFRYRRYHHAQAHEFVYFTLIVFVGLAISEGVLWAATENMDLAYTWSKVIATFFVFLFNFVVKKWLLFSPAPQTS